MGVKEIILIDKDDRKLYERLKEETIFQKKLNKDLFLTAVGYGFKNNVKKAINKTDNTFLRTYYLADEDWAFLKSLAISESSLDILKDMNEVLNIAEEYAHAGIEILVNEIDSFQIGTFAKKMEKDVVDFMKTNFEDK